MDLQVLFEKRLAQIDTLNDFIVLYGKKEEIIPDLRDINNETECIQELLVSCKEMLSKFQAENMKKCRELIEKSQQQQLLMLDVLDREIECGESTQIKLNIENECSPCAKEEPSRPVSVLNEISNTTTPSKFTPFKPGEQPVMAYADYVKSPYATKRMRPLALQFTDFERTISAEEFAKVPGYINSTNCSGIFSSSN